MTAPAIVDAWMQHPTREFLAQPMFDSLRRWAHGTLGGADSEIPIEATIAAMDTAGVRLGLVCAWWGPRGPLIANDTVAAFVRAHPDRLVTSASTPLHGAGHTGTPWQESLVTAGLSAGGLALLVATALIVAGLRGGSSRAA